MSGGGDERRARSRPASVGAALCGFLLLAAACGDGDQPAPAPAADGRAPDLTVAQDRLAPALESRDFPADSCEVQEACVDAPGTRRLLTFSTLVWNVGDAALVFGDPATNPAYELSPCHGHYHLQGFAAYELLDAAGGVLLRGHKQGFCVQDSEPLPGTGTRAQYIGCDSQGLTAGWGDLYASDLPCQWIDITELPPGTYQLRVTANPDGLIPEARLDNNVASTEVVIAPP